MLISPHSYAKYLFNLISLIACVISRLLWTLFFLVFVLYYKPNFPLFQGFIFYCLVLTGHTEDVLTEWWGKVLRFHWWCNLIQLMDGRQLFLYAALGVNWILFKRLCSLNVLRFRLRFGHCSLIMVLRKQNCFFWLEGTFYRSVLK